MLCVVTLLGRKRGHWLKKPAENEDAAWQQERLPEIPQNLHVRVCRGKQSSNVHSSLVIAKGVPYMTYALKGGGVPKKQTKGTKSADLYT